MSARPWSSDRLRKPPRTFGSSIGTRSPNSHGRKISPRAPGGASAARRWIAGGSSAGRSKSRATWSRLAPTVSWAANQQIARGIGAADRSDGVPGIDFAVRQMGGAPAAGAQAKVRDTIPDRACRQRGTDQIAAAGHHRRACPQPQIAGRRPRLTPPPTRSVEATIRGRRSSPRPAPLQQRRRPAVDAIVHQPAQMSAVRSGYGLPGRPQDKEILDVEHMGRARPQIRALFAKPENFGNRVLAGKIGGAARDPQPLQKRDQPVSGHARPSPRDAPGNGGRTGVEPDQGRMERPPFGIEPPPCRTSGRRKKSRPPAQRGRLRPEAPPQSDRWPSTIRRHPAPPTPVEGYGVGIRSGSRRRAVRRGDKGLPSARSFPSRTRG